MKCRRTLEGVAAFCRSLRPGLTLVLFVALDDGYHSGHCVPRESSFERLVEIAAA